MSRSEHDKAQEIKDRARGRKDLFEGLTARGAPGSVARLDATISECANLAYDVAMLAALVGSLADRLSPPESLVTTADQMAGTVEEAPSLEKARKANDAVWASRLLLQQNWPGYDPGQELPSLLAGLLRERERVDQRARSLQGSLTEALHALAETEAKLDGYRAAMRSIRETAADD
jgi:hypothetical protein